MKPWIWHYAYTSKKGAKVLILPTNRQFNIRFVHTFAIFKKKKNGTMLVHNRFFWIPVCWLALRSTRPYGLLRLMVITIFRFINKKENTRWILIAVDEHYNSTLGRFRRWRWNRPSDTHVCTNVYCIFAISRRTPETNYNDEWTLQLIMHVYIHDRRYLLIKTTNGSTVVRRIRPEKWRRVASGRDGVLRLYGRV